MSRASIGSAASFTFTVVAAAMTSPSRPVTCSVAARSAARYSLMRVSSTRVATPTPSSGMSRISAAVGSARAEHEAGEHREDEPARHVDHAVDELGDVLGVVAEVGDRFAGGADRLAGLGTTARHLGGEQVGAQQRLHVHPRLGPDERAVVDRRHADRLADRDGRRPPDRLVGVAGLECAEAAAEEVPGDGGHREEDHEQRPAPARTRVGGAATRARRASTRCRSAR